MYFLQKVLQEKNILFDFRLKNCFGRTNYTFEKALLYICEVLVRLNQEIY